MTRTALRVVDPHKTYGSVTALDRLSFTVQPGEIVGLLGPNGAGKTTTISMVLGVLQPTTGYVYIGDIDLAKKREEVLARTNFAAVYAALPGNLTVNENLKFFGWLYGIRSPSRRVAELLKEFDLVRLSHTKCGLLSSGEQTRAALAKALLNRPQLLLLDEPTASLDPAAAQLIREKIMTLAQRDGYGILWTSHNMSEVVAMCDRVLFLSQGRALLEGDPRRLPSEHGATTLEDLFIRVARKPLAEHQTVGASLLGAVLLWDFCTRIMQGVSTVFLKDVWSRNLLNLFASPLTISEDITGLVITSIMTSFIGVIVMVILATTVFHLQLFSLGLPLAGFLLVLLVFGITLGIFGSAPVLRFGPASEWLMWPLPALLSPFAAVFYPLSTLPHWMQGIAYALPPSYVFEGMRFLVAGRSFPAAQLAQGALQRGGRGVAGHV